MLCQDSSTGLKPLELPTELSSDLAVALIPVLSVLKYVFPDFVLLLLLHPTALASCSSHPPTDEAW